MNRQHMASWPQGVPHRLEVPERSVAQNLLDSAAAFPGRDAIIYHGGRISYRDLAAAVESLAGWLVAHAGVARGDRVLLYMQNSPQFVIGYYAILRADAVVVPVNPMNRAAELDHLLRDTGARTVIAGQELLDNLAPALAAGLVHHAVVAAYADAADLRSEPGLAPPLDAPGRADYGHPALIPWARALSAGLRPGPIAAGADDLAVIPYTSGTTGLPKGCMHSHRTVMTTIEGGLAWNPVVDAAVSLVSLPLFHVTGMQNSMNAPIRAGETMVIMTRWDRRLAAALIERYRVGRWRSIATMAIDFVNDPEVGMRDLSSLRAIGGGGATMPAAVAEKLRALTGLDYLEGYGMSETMAATHVNPPDHPRRQCLGIPVFDVDCRVLDLDTGAELGPGAEGEIVMAAPQNMLGYWNNPEATRAAFVTLGGKRFLRTGDIGRYDEAGYFYLTDRLKRMINVAGYKVWPTEVEAMMHAHPDIVEACVVAGPDARRGEMVVAVVVAARPVDEGAVIGWCHDRMSAYKCPRRVIFAKGLPRSPSGKVEWRRLQDAQWAEGGTGSEDGAGGGRSGGSSGGGAVTAADGAADGPPA